MINGELVPKLLSDELLQTSSIDLITSGCKEGRIGEIPGIVCVEGKYELGTEDGSAPVCVGVISTWVKNILDNDED